MVPAFNYLQNCYRSSVKCPIPGSVQNQVGQGLEQPGLVEGVPGVGMIFQVPSNPNHPVILGFVDITYFLFNDVKSQKLQFNVFWITPKHSQGNE